MNHQGRRIRAIGLATWRLSYSASLSRPPAGWGGLTVERWLAIIPAVMSGRDTFTSEETARIREQLRRLRIADRDEQQKIRAGLRRIGFRISDYTVDNAGFTVSDLGSLVARGVIKCGGTSAAAAMRPRASTGRGRGATRPEPRLGAQKRMAGDDASTAAIRALTSPRHTVAACMAGAVPDRPGLYAMYGDRSVWRALGLGEAPDDRPLYIGKAAESLVSRDLGTHFATGETGRSSPRRSFAALLVGELNLDAIPRRRDNPEPRKWAHYALEPDGDQRLTEWMREHLRLAVWPFTGTCLLAAVESDVMTHWKPPLNLVGVLQPGRSQVKHARAAMSHGERRENLGRRTQRLSPPGAPGLLAIAFALRCPDLKRVLRQHVCRSSRRRHSRSRDLSRSPAIGRIRDAGKLVCGGAAVASSSRCAALSPRTAATTDYGLDSWAGASRPVGDIPSTRSCSASDWLRPRSSVKVILMRF